MASPEDTVAATKVVSENPPTVMGGSGSKSLKNGVNESGLGNKGGGSEHGVAAETVGDEEKEKHVDVNLSIVSDEMNVDDEEKERNVDVNLSTVSDEMNVDDEEKEKNVDVNLSSVSIEMNVDVEAVENNKDSGVTTEGEEEDSNTGYKQGESDGMDETTNDHDNVFHVGDFVWGKIKSHPWWPGQVYDPKDASEFAMKRKQEGRLLVAFFGDGSCSWCLPSQLIPFMENFVEMSANSSSKSFLNAVEKAIDEVGRLVESDMIGKCIPQDKKDTLVRPLVENAGLKDGVMTPEVDINRLAIPKYESAEIVQKVRQLLAKSVTIGNALELVVLRSWLSAFYYFRHGYRLTVYHEPLDIEGMEDKDKNDNEVLDDFSVPIEVPILGPLSDNKGFHRRKQKSVAELMRESKNTKPESKKRATVKAGIDLENSSSQKKKKKKNGEVEGAGNKAAKTSRKRKAEASDEKLKDIEDADEDKTPVAKEEFEMVSSPRERKKSKYLSPPYTNLTWKVGNSSFKSDLEKSHTGEHNKAASEEPVSESKLANGQSESLEIPVDPNVQIAEKEKKNMSFSASDVDIPVNKLLSEMQFAALDPLYLSNKGSLDNVWAFISALRSATYLHGPDYKIYCKTKTGEKKKLLLSELGNQDTEEKAKSGDQKSRKAAKKMEGQKFPSLILAFTPGFPLPSKEDIVNQFGEFGRLNSKETKVLKDSHTVKIVYMNDSDAEAAFRSSLISCPFGSDNVNYKLQRSSCGSKSSEKPKVSSPRKRASNKRATPEHADDLVSDVSSIRQKLDIMTAILENYHSKFSAEDRSIVKDDMKHLMEKVEMTSEKVRVMAENASS